MTEHKTNEFDLAKATFELMSNRLNFDERIVEEITNLQILIRTNRELYINTMKTHTASIVELQTEIVALREIVDRIRFLLKDLATV
jgi:hypothetical protein